MTRTLPFPLLQALVGDEEVGALFSNEAELAAMLQAEAPDNLALLRVDTKAGHGLGKPTAKVIEEFSDIYAFLFEILGVDVGVRS